MCPRPAAGQPWALVNSADSGPSGRPESDTPRELNKITCERGQLRVVRAGSEGWALCLESQVAGVASPSAGPGTLGLDKVCADRGRAERGRSTTGKWRRRGSTSGNGWWKEGKLPECWRWGERGKGSGPH